MPMNTVTAMAAREIGRRRAVFPGAFFWVLAFFAVYCGRPEDWIPGLGHLHIAMITGISALIAFLLSLGRWREGLPIEALYLVLLLIQFAMASILSPVWKGGAVFQTIDFAKMVLIVLVMMVAVTSLERLRKLIYVQAACAAVVAFLSIRYSHVVAGRLDGVLRGMYGSCNDLAIASVLSLPLCLVFLLRSNGICRRVIWTAALLAMLYATLRTGSRAGFLALLIATAVSLWELGIRGRRPYLILIGIIGSVVLFLAAGQQVNRRLSDTFSSTGDYEYAEASASARRQLLKRSLEVTSEHPLFGVGLGDFQIISGRWQPTHNVYTALSSEAGIPALILFLMIYYRAFANLRHIRKAMPVNSELWMFAGALRASLWAFAFAGLFSPDAYQYFVYFTLAFTTCVYRIGVDSGAAPVGLQAAVTKHQVIYQRGFLSQSKAPKDETGRQVPFG